MKKTITNTEEQNDSIKIALNYARGALQYSGLMEAVIQIAFERKIKLFNTNRIKIIDNSLSFKGTGRALIMLLTENESPRFYQVDYCTIYDNNSETEDGVYFLKGVKIKTWQEIEVLENYYKETSEYQQRDIADGLENHMTEILNGTK